MKILKLQFKNLNSLAGEWAIDFSDPCYVTDGIFAITGPTGAGKTTILDAITLALYGSTPRLDRVTGGSNDIMSKGTAECSSELTFELPSGRYRCNWSQHRAKRRWDGDLQNAKHELANADTGAILASSLKLVPERVESITGLDFTRFTRSMLLAQGAFAAFLQSKSSERAPILEQLTRTDIYSRLSIKVHARERQERDRSEELERKIQDLSLMSPEAEAAARQELQGLETELAALSGQLEELRRQAQWRGEIDKLQAEIAKGEADQHQLAADLVAFQPQRTRLARATVAAELDGPAAKLEQLRKAVSEAKSKLKQLETDLPQWKSACLNQEARLKEAESARRQAEADQARFEPERLKMEECDRRIKTKREFVEEAERKLGDLEKKAAAERTALKDLVERKAQLDRNFAEGEAFLQAHAGDEWLVTGLSGLKFQLDNLQATLQGISAKEKELASTGEVISGLKRELETFRKREVKEQAKVQEIEQRIESCEQEIREALQGRTLSEVQAELDERRVQKERANLVASLEEHRARLHPGEECPLCGSLEHPFIAGAIPEPNELDAAIARFTGQAAKVTRAGEEVKQLWSKKCEADQALSEAKDKLARHLAKVEREEIGLKGFQEALAKLRLEREQLESRLLVDLRPLGIEQLAEQDSDDLRDSLSKRKSQWETTVKRNQELERQQATVREDLGRGEALVLSLQEQLDQLSQDKHQHVSALAEEMSLRKEQFGERNPAVEAAELEKALKSASGLERDEQKRMNEAKEKLAGLVAQHSECCDILTSREQEIQPVDEAFQRELGARGFASETEFEAARVSAEQRRELSQQDEELKKRAILIEKFLAEQRTRLSDEQAKNLTSESLESLKAMTTEKDQAFKELNEKKGAQGQILRDNETRKERAAECGQELARQKIECQRWSKLHDLIGSSDGKKFRNFAQAVTFERLIAHANQQLAKMSDRYELLPSANDPLDLSVRDNDQGGEVRTTRNLSGGESFMVSLALALGLSKMASGRVRVDSLFLDEGFGTLDEGALDTALNTLADLRHTGKLIGLISHVAALNERINTKIEVRKIGDGRSELEGPGCQRISRG